MLDRKNKKINVGNKVLFSLNYDVWKGEVILLNEEKEVVTIQVTERETGVGMIERLNFIECNRYITIINN